MSRRAIRKKEQQRRRNQIPRATVVLAAWVEPGPSILADTARRAFESLKAGRFAATRHQPTGPDQRCYANVERQIELLGGKEVTGWLVTVNNSSRLAAGRNKYARFSLEAHSVWEKDGELIEVTGGGHCKFITDDSVEHMTNGNLFFCDNDICVKRLVNRPMPKRITSRYLMVTL